MSSTSNYSHVIFDRGAKNKNWKEKKYLQPLVCPHAEELDPRLLPSTKIRFKQIRSFSWKPEAVNTPRRKHKHYPTRQRCRIALSEQGPVGQGIKANHQQLGLHKTNTFFCTAKEATNHVKKKQTHRKGKKLCQLYIRQRNTIQNTKNSKKQRVKETDDPI